MGEIVLGLDLGPNSIGWALVDEAKQQIIAAGVRVFPEGVDAFDTSKEKSRSQNRRSKRGMRRQIARRARRKRRLRELLTRHGLLPSDSAALDRLLQKDPYQLRAMGLDQRLTPHDFGRALLHLATRRGFLSNRKSDRAKEKETSQMLQQISDLEQEIKAAGHRTLGEHLWALAARPGDKPLMRIRGRHTRRDMLRDEFNKLWESQKKYHPALLTEELKKQLDDPEGDQTWWMRGAIFGQRRMYWPASMIGRCELEPRERRCPKAERIAQRYRLLTEVNNLKYIDPQSGRVCPLDQTQRRLLLDHLSRRKDMSFDAIRRLLGMLETVRFNLEKGERPKLKGNGVDYVMAKESPWGSDWWELPEPRKDEIVRILADPRATDEAITAMAVQKWGLSREDALKLLGVQLPAGYMSLSRKAMEKLVPHLEQGLPLMSDDGTPSAMAEAGYLRPDQRSHKLAELLGEPPDLPNPVVRQAMHELRTVVNAIIREFGRPSRIHIELARSIRMGRADRDKYNQARQEREEQRQQAAEDIRQQAPGVRISRDLIDKYLLWIEQGKRCVYSGRMIGLQQLLGGEVDVDHIFPRWRSLDDSFANKVVCFRDMNREKADRTPFEWLSGDPQRFELVKNNTRGLPWRKRARFTQEKLETDEFAARQLVDTAYITRKAVEYLRCLVDKPHHVLAGKGTYTAELRHLWGLETILSELPDSPAWAKQAHLRPGEKNRADHRHHAIDAIVIALTDQRRLQALSRLYKTGQAGAETLPWDGLRDTVRSVVEKINVSHRVQRRVSGALHEETIYGRTQKPAEFVTRKPLEELTPAMVEDIRDAGIRRLVMERLARFGVKTGRGATARIPKEAWKEPILMPSGVPVKKVRIIKRDETIRPLRQGQPAYVKPGSTHHLCIFEYMENGRPRYEAVFVSMLEAMERIKARQPIIQRTHPKRSDARFIMSLSAREVVLVTIDGRQGLYRFDTAASTTEQMTFYPIAAADHVEKMRKYPESLMKLNPKKVTIDPIGRMRWAND